MFVFLKQVMNFLSIVNFCNMSFSTFFHIVFHTLWQVYGSKGCLFTEFGVFSTTVLEIYELFTLEKLEKYAKQ